MPYITIQELSFLGQKIQECGTRWDAVMKRWAKEMKPKDAIQEPKTVKIDKESLFTRWESFIIQWALNTSKKQSTHSN